MKNDATRTFIQQLLSRALSRRAFLRAAGRSGAFALLVLVAARVSRRTPAADQCVQDGVCRACTRFSACALPQAIANRSIRGGAA